MNDKMRTAVVSLVIIAGYLCFGYLLLTGRIKPEVSGDVALTLVGAVFGVLTAAFIVAISFELGSSVGSRSKDAIIAGQAPSPPAVPTAPKPRPPTSVPTPPAPPATPPPKPPTEPPAHPATPSARNVMTFAGRVSEFGGPDDSGVGPDEGLALCEPGEKDKFAVVVGEHLFLDAQPAGTTGLARRLNPHAFYLACRWNYKRTPKSWLQKTLARVSANGLSILAQPIDWGPNEDTGRAIDMSPGLMGAFHLTTDDVATVEIELPPGAPPEAPSETDAIPHLKVLTGAQLDAKFGPFPYTEGPHGTVIPDQAWVAANIITITIPQLSHLVHNGTIECHKRAADPLKAVFAEVEAAGLMGDVLTFDGLWVPRHIGSDPRRGISRHSRGLALDLNAEWNPYGGRPAAPGAKGSCWRLAPIFERHGFAWGAWFGRSSLDGPPASDTDGMHMEYAGEA